MNGEHVESKGVPTTEERAFATDWLHANIRVKRKGELYELEVQQNTLVVNFEITEQQAGELRFLWA